MHIECYHKCPRSRWESSEYRGQIYDIQDAFDKEDVDSTLGCIEDLKYDLEDRLENMPEQLRDSNSGCILQERIEALEDAYNNIETLRDELEEIMNWEYEDYKDEYDSEEDFEDAKETEIDDKASEIDDELYNLDI
jgi:uncharacterized protein YfcZ (UPF0381/DUF406 family)